MKPQIKYSDKQKKFIRTPLNWLNIVIGAMRSGKTYITNLMFVLQVRTRPVGCKYIMIARTRTALKDNILMDLERICGGHFKYSIQTGEGKLFGRLVRLTSADNDSAYKVLRGSDWDGALVDEIPMMPENYITMLLTRLITKPNAFLLATGNPENLKNHIKVNIIDDKRKADKLNYWTFNFEDNPILTEEMKEHLRISFTPGSADYRRNVLSEWCNSEGIVFQQFESDTNRWVYDEKPKSGRYRELVIGVDFGGNSSRTVFVCAGLYYGENGLEIHILDEHTIAAGKDIEDANKATLSQSSEYIVEQFMVFAVGVMQRYGMIARVNCDYPSSLIASIQLAINRRGWPIVAYPVNKSVISLKDWIKKLNTGFNHDVIKIHKDCKNVIDSFATLLYDEKANNDLPLDDGKSCDMDTYDATRYAIVDFMVRDDIKRVIP